MQRFVINSFMFNRWGNGRYKKKIQFTINARRR